MCAKMESNVLTMANVIDERELIESAAQIAQEKCTREAVLLATGNVAQAHLLWKVSTNLPVCSRLSAYRHHWQLSRSCLFFKPSNKDIT